MVKYVYIYTLYVFNWNWIFELQEIAIDMISVVVVVTSGFEEGRGWHSHMTQQTHAGEHSLRKFSETKR
jgi:hypothetical protein